MFTSQAYTSRAYEGQQIRPTQIDCRFHSGQICLNYCVERACLKMLCSQCIQDHVLHHKQTGQSDLSIKSMKKVRQYCVDKLNKLMQELFSRMSMMKQPKSPQEIIEQTKKKLQEIKLKMYEIIEEEFNKFNEQIRIRVNQSAASIHKLGEIHEKLNRIIMQLKECKGIVIEGNKELPQTIQKVLQLDNVTYVNLFGKQAISYSQQFSSINFDISLNQQNFRKTVSESLKINNYERQQFAVKPAFLPIPESTPRSKYASNANIQIPKLSHSSSQIKILHFFQAGQSYLHLIDMGNGKKKTKIPLPEFVVPDFHATILSHTGYIFISGGILQVGGSEVKMKYLCRYSIKTGSFKKQFAKVRPRSSHSMCENGNYIYILGGYGPENNKKQTQSQNRVERINIKKGQVSEEEPSKWGGANISVVMNDRIIKASTQGVEAYDLVKRHWKVLHVPENYLLYHGCGWSKLSEEHLLIYGGYKNNAKAVDNCELWLVTQNEILIKQVNSLPKSEGFSNNPGIILGGRLYVIQNVPEKEDDNEESFVVEGERNILCFDEKNWQQV